MSFLITFQLHVSMHIFKEKSALREGEPEILVIIGNVYLWDILVNGICGDTRGKFATLTMSLSYLLRKLHNLPLPLFPQL